MKFTAAILVAGVSAVSATFNNNVQSIGYSITGLRSAVEAYTIPDYYAAQSINQATVDVQGLIGDAIQVAKSIENLADDVAHDAVETLKHVLDEAKKINYLIEKQAAVFAEDVEQLGESAAHFVLGGFANIEQGAVDFIDTSVRLFVGGLAAEVRTIGGDLIGAFHNCVDIL
jgi:hypothetical protein